MVVPLGAFENPSTEGTFVGMSVFLFVHVEFSLRSLGAWWML